MASQPRKLHIFFFPLMAPGHIIPMLDLAKLFALRGVGATVLATPTSTPFLRDTVDRARGSGGYSINLLVLPPPSSSSSSSSFTNGAENLTSPEMSPEFFTALESFRKPLEEVLREHRPSCIVSDMFMPFTGEVANGLNIPRLVFHSMGFFPLCVIDSVDRSISNGSISSVDDDKDTVVIPGLPHRIEMKRSQLHNPTGARNGFSEFMERVKESELKSHGAAVNSFYELEPEYADHYRAEMGRQAWCVGPLSLIDSEAAAEAQHDSVVAWLDSKPPRSVVYVCFGSLSQPTAAQLREIEGGLESSGHFYLWVVRSEYDGIGRFNNENGMVVEGWAPQRAILRHAAVGAFVTHCGWNSLLEGASAGVPIVTWPMFAEQFYNERLVVEVLGIGVGVGAAEWGMREEEKRGRVVGREEIRRAVCCVMDGGDAEGEGEGVRRRVAEVREAARRAVETAGSSHAEVGRLIDELLNGLRPIMEG